jgi:hypothetical protein
MKELEKFFRELDKAANAEKYLNFADGYIYTEVTQICFTCRIRTRLAYEMETWEGTYLGTYCFHCAKMAAAEALIGKEPKHIVCSPIKVDKEMFKSVKRIHTNYKKNNDEPF